MGKRWEEIKEVFELLQDDLSKKIFECKIEHMLVGEEDKTIDLMYDEYKNSHITLLEKNFGKEIKCAIAGAGNFGEKTYKALTHAEYEVVCFIDNDVSKQGMLKCGKPILSFVDFCMKYNDVVVILDNLKFSQTFYHELMNLGYPQNRIFWNVDNIVRSSFGNIYFDLPQLYHDKEEVFLDAGSFNGETSLEFIKWCGGDYKKIYAFEPLEEGMKLSKNNLSKCRDIELIKCALGDENGVAEFTYSFDGLMGARVAQNDNEKILVPVKSIDSILEGQRATFIKMDIEGAELSALKGAEKTIRTYRPKLAISLYHKKQDIIDIPLWISHTMPEYKFFLRHYSNKQWDFVLYCI